MTTHKSRGGFTLVEIIVVLVIIAILAAIALPALTGYIKDANDKAAISEARTVWVAMQSTASRMMGLGYNPRGIEVLLNDKGSNAPVSIKHLTGLTSIKEFSEVEVSSAGVIEEFIYDSTPKVYLYDGELHTTAKTAAPST